MLLVTRRGPGRDGCKSWLATLGCETAAGFTPDRELAGGKAATSEDKRASFRTPLSAQREGLVWAIGGGVIVVGERLLRLAPRVVDRRRGGLVAEAWAPALGQSA